VGFVVDAIVLRQVGLYSSILPPMLHTRLYLHVGPKRKIDGLETFQKSETEEKWLEKESEFLKSYSFTAIWGNKLFTVRTFDKTAWENLHP
jgi:hypothetical protein